MAKTKSPGRKKKAAEKAQEQSQVDGSASAESQDSITATKSAPEKPKRGRKPKAAKAAAEQKPPAQPFGDALPGGKEHGSPADRNWMATGDPERDVATLESQERFLYRVMVRYGAERAVAKAQAKMLLIQAEETSVTDGFAIADKISLHKQAESADIKAGKAEKEFKRAREGWAAVKMTIHRYLTEPEQPLFEQGKKKGQKAA